MARQAFYSEPWKKHLEVYTNFSLGLNTVTSHDNMLNEELSDIDNMDLADRGALKRRYGMKTVADPHTGKGQGFFRFYRTPTDYDDVLAVDGQLYFNGVQKGPSFQTEKPIEAVQFGDKMYFATGTRFLQYDGEVSEVEPHAPNPLEALYIGTNALADDPDNFLSDGVDSVLSIDGVTFSSRYGVMNEPFTLTAYYTAPEGTVVEYQFEYRYPFMEDGKWYLGQDWSESKSWTHTAEGEGELQFRINAREQGNEVAEAQYLVPKYKIKPAPDPNDEEPDVSAIHSCNRILLHWDRLILYGDETNADMIYISHLNNPSYFPVPNCLRFENGRKEALTTLVKFRDSLIAFTPTSIQALYGKSPLDYRRVVLNTSIGCMAPYSAVVVKNYIYFLSQEGVHYLKSLGYVDDKANVEKLDEKIDDVMPRKKSACGVFYDGQYHLTFPEQGKRFRFYFDLGSWVKDTSPKLDFTRMYTLDGTLYGQSVVDGSLKAFDKELYDDDGYVYEDVLETKFFSFGQPYHTKKLKELQVLVSPVEGKVSSSVFVYADAAAILNPDRSKAVVNEDGSVSWEAEFEPNLIAQSGTTLGKWSMGESPFGEVEHYVDKLNVSGKCLRTKVRIVHQENLPNKILGLGYIFKIKKP
jgi:hypothetical protein